MQQTAANQTRIYIFAQIKACEETYGITKNEILPQTIEPKRICKAESENKISEVRILRNFGSYC